MKKAIVGEGKVSVRPDDLLENKAQANKVQAQPYVGKVVGHNRCWRLPIPTHVVGCIEPNASACTASCWFGILARRRRLQCHPQGNLESGVACLSGLDPISVP